MWINRYFLFSQIRKKSETKYERSTNPIIHLHGRIARVAVAVREELESFRTIDRIAHARETKFKYF